PLPVDLASNAASLGIDVIRIEPGPSAIDQLSAAMARAKASETATLIHIHSDPLLFSIDGGGWWDVPVAEVSTLATTAQARAEYERKRKQQRPLLG
ncbi:MAG TPA: 3D-(3,5/4)-trihydroxycyclohexane-1,2-dione acylhydrolase (decyclizing), partial [Galbitalea sp.]